MAITPDAATARGAGAGAAAPADFLPTVRRRPAARPSPTVAEVGRSVAHRQAHAVQGVPPAAAGDTTRHAGRARPLADRGAFAERGLPGAAAI